MSLEQYYSNEVFIVKNRKIRQYFVTILSFQTVRNLRYLSSFEAQNILHIWLRIGNDYVSIERRKKATNKSVSVSINWDRDKEKENERRFFDTETIDPHTLYVYLQYVLTVSLQFVCHLSAIKKKPSRRAIQPILQMGCAEACEFKSDEQTTERMVKLTW